MLGCMQLGTNIMMFYSASTKGFYSKEIHGTEIPRDAIEITENEYTELLRGQSQGSQIKGDLYGKPTLSPRDVDSVKVERAWRDSELTRADIELNKVQDSDPKAKGTVTQWREYRKALRALPEHPQFPSVQARPVAPDA